MADLGAIGVAQNSRAGYSQVRTNSSGVPASPMNVRKTGAYLGKYVAGNILGPSLTPIRCTVHLLRRSTFALVKSAGVDVATGNYGMYLPVNEVTSGVLYDIIVRDTDGQYQDLIFNSVTIA